MSAVTQHILTTLTTVMMLPWGWNKISIQNVSDLPIPVPAIEMICFSPHRMALTTFSCQRQGQIWKISKACCWISSTWRLAVVSWLVLEHCWLTCKHIMLQGLFFFGYFLLFLTSVFLFISEIIVNTVFRTGLWQLHNQNWLCLPMFEARLCIAFAEFKISLKSLRLVQAIKFCKTWHRARRLDTTQNFVYYVTYYLWQWVTQ